MRVPLDRHVLKAGVPELNRRLPWLLGFMALAFLVLMGRLFQLQIVNGEAYFSKSINNFIKERRIPPVRGRIVDKKGAVLADNRPAFNVYVTPRYYTAEAHANLVRVLGLGAPEAEEIHARVEKIRRTDRFRQVLILEDVDRDRVALIEQARAELPGVDVEDVPHRLYAEGTLAAHVLGYLNQVSDAELETNRGHEPGDYIGRYGIEKQWEETLRGKKGLERYVVDARGLRKSGAEDLIQGERFVPPVPGHTVVLTIDAALQRLAERALRNHAAGGIAVVEVKTGRILALVSKPAFDPNVMTGHLSRAEEARLGADPHKPFLDKTLRQHYYPGSTYKVVGAIAALEDNLVTPEERVFCKGWHNLGKRAFRCTKAHGSVNLVEALTQSCNVYFWEMAERAGIDRLARVATDLGFGTPTGIGLNGDVPGRVPWKTWYEQHGGMRPGYTLNTVIGQGDTEVTVLQLALAYAALANGGSLFAPQLVERIETAEGTQVSAFEPRLRHRLQVSQRTLEIVQRGLFGVVHAAKGTAHGARLDGISVAGKTGTAQVRKLTKQAASGEWSPTRDHAWFAGYAPAADPRIAVVVLVEHGGKGGHVAAPVAMEIVKAWMDLEKPGAAPPAPVSDADESPEPPRADDLLPAATVRERP